MARAKTQAKIPITKIRLEVTDINEHTNTILLEGVSGDFKYVLMIDAELDQKMVNSAVVGDKWDISLANAIKLTRKPTSGSTVGATVKSGQMKGNVCMATGKIVLKKDVIMRRAKGAFYNTPRITCPDCGKDIAVNGGYSGKPYIIRKHNV